MNKAVEKNYKKNDYMNIKDDTEVVKNWEPLRFEISDNYKYVSKNKVFNIISNVISFFVMIILTLFNKFVYGYKVINKKKKKKKWRICKYIKSYTLYGLHFYWFNILSS